MRERDDVFHVFALCAVPDHLQNPAGFLFRCLLERSDQGEGDLLFFHITADRLADNVFLACIIEQIVPDLKRHPDILAKVSHQLPLTRIGRRACSADHGTCGEK